MYCAITCARLFWAWTTTTILQATQFIELSCCYSVDQATPQIAYNDHLAWLNFKAIERESLLLRGVKEEMQQCFLPAREDILLWEQQQRKLIFILWTKVSFATICTSTSIASPPYTIPLINNILAIICIVKVHFEVSEMIEINNTYKSTIQNWTEGWFFKFYELKRILIADKKTFTEILLAILR